MRRAFCLQGIMYGKAMVMKTRTAAAARLFRGRGLRIAGVFFWGFGRIGMGKSLIGGCHDKGAQSISSTNGTR